MLKKVDVEMVALKLYNEGIIRFFEKPRKLASGLESRLFLDMESVPKDKIFLKNFKDQLEEWLRNNSKLNVGLIFPVPLGGRPWIEIIQSCFPEKLPVLRFSKEQIIAESSGDIGLTPSQCKILAERKNNDVLIIEDIITTGGSTEKAAKCLELLELKPKIVVAAIDRLRKRNADFKKRDLEFFSFLDIRQILQRLMNIPQILENSEREIAENELQLLMA